eukprot:scaffold1277_cov137-Skeletonema_menzelii.AAC.1
MPGFYHRSVTTLDVGSPSSSSSDERWESFKILFHGFADLPSAVGEYTLSPGFTCNGHKWCLQIYPGGERESAGFVSVFLVGQAATTATYEVGLQDKSQRVQYNRAATGINFDSNRTSLGWPKYGERSNILNNHLDDDGTLAVLVSIKRDADPPFVPSNPMSGMITGMFLDEETADVCFQVSNGDVREDVGDEEASLPVTFHAHRLILKACAPMLASLFGSDDENEKIARVSITDINPTIFHHILHYVYGGSVPDGEMNAHAKDFISAADKYSIVNLKLQAEAAYVKSTEITIGNAIDILLYADSLNCAFLKEA